MSQDKARYLLELSNRRIKFLESQGAATPALVLRLERANNARLAVAVEEKAKAA